ncbi:electron transfer flavoprotein, alpha subunit (macronuclear) [Tetrahymena thermophila SB210]|uniref:Electron transfer flavoprotein subunit alpha n=1 Tax=Tetrahymena thermophila (strain SB210) TaxID=312017 RepID=Q23FT7_TETTS|nr:electron transfer flavoprotein, alpha subunit [Tetrahymena thermophila SB210]EAR95523.1 electron transfer flavoprotein, alpha subunit [Tetrahymena thermophila SB210]|eukprot:XP_001015768.1 electron transfer flavoprotein, alpha subunit [Tetrahymena thermophila SB210]
MFAKTFKQFSCFNKNNFSTLVVAEHNGEKLSKSMYKILNAASKFKEETHLLVTGENVSKVVENIKATVPKEVVSKIIVADSALLKHNQAQAVSQVISNLINQNKYKQVVVDSSSSGKDILPRVAAKFNTQPATDVTNIISNDTFQRPVYAGNAISTIKLTSATKFLSFRATSFDAINSEQANNISDVQKVDADSLIAKKDNLVKHIKDEIAKSERPELTSARFVVSGGRGLKSKDNFSILENLAGVLGETAIGASRAAVDAGYAPNDLQVGQTGKVVAPELYIAVGISGAIQHLAGMKDSKVIVAINQDPEAPIFQISTYGLVGDLFKIVPELTEKVKAAKQ